MPKEPNHSKRALQKSHLNLETDLFILTHAYLQLCHVTPRSRLMASRFGREGRREGEGGGEGEREILRCGCGRVYRWRERGRVRARVRERETL